MLVASFQFRFSNFQFRFSSFDFPISIFEFPFSRSDFPVSNFAFRFSSRHGKGVDGMSPLYLAHSKEIAARVMDGEMMIMSARDSTLFSLNELGTIIWQAADGATPLGEIVERKICSEFDVEPEEALKDAEEFVRELAGHGILVVSESPLGESRSKKEEARSKKEEGRRPDGY